MRGIGYLPTNTPEEPQIFAEVCITFGASLREFSGEADHVHLLIEYPPVVRLSDLIRTLKAVSSP